MHRHNFAAKAPHVPLGHFADHSHRLAVERFFNALNHLDVCDAAVYIHHEATHHSALNAIVIGVIWIFAGFVDEIHQCSFAARKLWLNVHIIIFIDVDVC